MKHILAILLLVDHMQLELQEFDEEFILAAGR
jgi:hypothetical protein